MSCLLCTPLQRKMSSCAFEIECIFKQNITFIINVDLHVSSRKFVTTITIKHLKLTRVQSLSITATIFSSQSAGGRYHQTVSKWCSTKSQDFDIYSA